MKHRVYVLPNAFGELKGLPGSVRQRIRREIDELADDPRPAGSKRLDIELKQRELRRLRLDLGLNGGIEGELSSETIGVPPPLR